MALDAAAEATLAAAWAQDFATARGGGAANAKEIALCTSLVSSLTTFVQTATGIPNTTTAPLLDSLGAPVTGEVDIT